LISLPSAVVAVAPQTLDKVVRVAVWSIKQILQLALDKFLLLLRVLAAQHQLLADYQV
jgi:hypothetical protein